MISSSAYQTDYTTYANNTKFNGLTPSDTGYITTLLEYFINVMLIVFNFYDFCKFDNFLILIGNIAFKQSAAGAFINNLLFVLTNYLTNKSNSELGYLQGNATASG